MAATQYDYSESDCYRALRRAARELGESPTKAQYEALGYQPASATIIRICGGWNAAKEGADLETFAQSPGGGDSWTGSASPTTRAGPPYRPTSAGIGRTATASGARSNAA